MTISIALQNRGVLVNGGPAEALLGPLVAAQLLLDLDRLAGELESLADAVEEQAGATPRGQRR